ncbi:MAG: prolipoprotein diacylglyceryl transferase family protein [Chloroflexota bacterium]
MNPVVFKFASIELHAFTAWIMLGVAIGGAVLVISAARSRQRISPLLDVILAGVIGGIIGARAVHVWLNWGYFAAHTDQITDLANGGLDWHGAIVVGLAAALVVARLRGVSILLLVDGLALALPFGAMASWQACAAATCGYGVEVRTLADFPSWLVIESPDIYGTVAPRLNLPPIGIVLAVVILLLVVLLTVFNSLSGSRLWLVLALFAEAMAIIAFFRAEYVPLWFGHRADQILDFVVAFVSIVIFGVAAVLHRRRFAAHRVIEQGA